jgi:UDP:flavonoid glycosyltransferase YjiC (YdhE family)
VLNYDHWAPGAAVAQLKRLLNDPAVTRHARDAAQQVAHEDGAKTAADIVTHR